jgi:hypothetical protein
MAKTLNCVECFDRCFTFNKAWFDWFSVNRDTSSYFSIPPDNYDSILTPCDFCNKNNCLDKTVTQNQAMLLQSIISLAEKANIFFSKKETTTLSIDKQKNINQDKILDRFEDDGGKISTAVKKTIEGSTVENTEKKQKTKTTIYTPAVHTPYTGYGQFNYGTYSPPTRTYYIDSRTYRIEKNKDEKVYSLFDNNDRLLHVFNEIPTEQKVREVHDYVVSYQKRYTKEQRIECVSSLVSALERVKPVLLEALLELEFSGITDRDIFLDMKALVRNHKTALNTLRQAKKTLLPPEEKTKQSKEKSEQQTNTNDVSAKKNKKQKKHSIEGENIASLKASNETIFKGKEETPPTTPKCFSSDEYFNSLKPVSSEEEKEILPTPIKIISSETLGSDNLVEFEIKVCNSDLHAEN